MNQKTLILSIPVMLAVILLGGWFLSREPKSAPESQNPPAVKENPPQNAGNLQSPANVDTSIDTSNWKTYWNEKYGFELKYPAEWVATTPSKNMYNEVLSLTSRDTDSKLMGAQNQAGDNVVIHVLASIREDAHVKSLGDSVKNLEDFLSLDVSQTEMRLIEKIEFGGRPAYVVGVFGLTGHYGIIFETESGVYKIVFEKTNLSMSQGKQMENKLTDILSDREIGILASLKIWKTYRNEALKLSFKYPDTFRLDEVARDNSGQVVSIMEYDENARDLAQKPMPGYFPAISLYFWEDLNDPYLKGGEWIGQKKYNNFQEFLADSEHTHINVISEMNIDEVRAYYLSMPGEMGYGAVMFEYSGGYYRIGFPPTQKPLDENIEEEVISSIELLK